MGQRLPSQHPRALGLLTLGKPLPLRPEADGTWGRLPRGPREIRVAIFDVALALTLAVTDCRTRDTAAVRGRVANRRQATTVTRFQHHRLGHYLPDAIDAQQLLIGGRVFQTLTYGFFSTCDLLAQAVKHRQAAGDRQDLLGLGQQAVECFLRERVHPLGTEAHTSVSPHDVLPTQHSGRMLTNHVSAFAYYIPHGPLGFGGDRAFGQHAQSSHMGQPAGIGMVIRLLQTTVLLHRCWVSQMHPGACLHQPIDEPVPVGG